MTFRPKVNPTEGHESRSKYEPSLLDCSVHSHHDHPLPKDRIKGPGCCDRAQKCKRINRDKNQFAEAAKNSMSPQDTHHNAKEAYVHHADFELMKTAIIASSQVEGMLQICNLSRRTLGQTGDGHFSPVGGFNEPAN